ncbi:MAG: ACP S-malonyltransferase [Christensenellaceae bacterium]
MSKLAALFSGQGAQKPGMGKSLYDTSPRARTIFERAEAIRPGIKDLCFSGTQEELDKTIHTQPCIFTVDVAAYTAFSEIAQPAYCAGFSLGEYAALTCGGVMPFEDVFRLVLKRAEWMQQAADEHPGGMVAVLGKTSDEVDALLDKVRGDGLLMGVNYNCPGQIVVAGDLAELNRLLEYAKENKIKCVRLNTGGAFHSPYMESASEKIFEAVQDMNFLEPLIPLYSNKTAQLYELPTMKKELADQTKCPVLFEKIIRDMIKRGCDTFVETGQGNTLLGFVRRIDKSVNVFHVDDAQSFNEAADSLNALGF